MVEKVVVAKGELALTVTTPSILNVLEFLRDHTNCQYKVLADLTAVDYPDRPERFEVVYNLVRCCCCGAAAAAAAAAPP